MGASSVAGAIHLAVAPEHFEHWWVYGTFFLLVGGFQLVFAWLALRRPSLDLSITGIVANLGVVLIYVASRTTGLPIAAPEEPTSATSHGDAHGVDGVEGIGALDLIATSAELLVVCLLVTLLPPAWRRAAVHLLLLLGLALWVLRIVLLS